MQVCKNCGAELHGGKFCPECGTPIKVQTENASNLTQTNLHSLPPVGPKNHYKVNKKVIEVLIRHQVIDTFDRVIICGGSYFPNRDSFFLIVTYDNLIFAKINDSNIQDDSIVKMDYNDPRVSNFYNPSRCQFNIDENDIGFNPKKFIIYPGTKSTIFHEVQRMRDITLGTYHEPVIQQQKQTNTPTQFSSHLTPKPQTKRERIKENRANGIACCPKCGSTSLAANKKGFGVGKAVTGAFIAGPFGLIAGNMGAKKVWVTCLNCGHRWKI